MKIFLMMTGLVFSLSSLQNFAVAQTAEKPVGVEKKANCPTSIPDALKKIADAQAADAGQSAQGGVLQPTRNVPMDLVNTHIDLLKSDVSRLETARHEADKKWTSNVEDLKLLERINALEASSERIKELEAGIKALSTEARQQKELQGFFSQEVTRLSASLAAKRCESGYGVFQPHHQPNIGNGYRTHKKRIAFSTPFASVPVIAAGIHYLDVGNAANTRLATLVTNVDLTGFDLSMYEWADSHTYGGRAVWMACAN